MMIILFLTKRRTFIQPRTPFPELERGFQHLPRVVRLAALVVDEDLQLDLVLDPELLPQLLHQLFPVGVAAEGGAGRAEGGLGEVGL